MKVHTLARCFDTMGARLSDVGCLRGRVFSFFPFLDLATDRDAPASSVPLAPQESTGGVGISRMFHG